MFFQYFADQKANLFETGMAILCASARLCTFVFTTQVTVIPPPTIGNSGKAPNPQTQTLTWPCSPLPEATSKMQRAQDSFKSMESCLVFFSLCFPIGTEAGEGAKLPFLMEKCYLYLLMIVFQILGRIDHM